MQALIHKDDHWIADLRKQMVQSLCPHAELVCLGSAVMPVYLATRKQPPVTDSNDQACLRRLAGLA